MPQEVKICFWRQPPSSSFPAVDVCVCVRRGGESGEKKPCLFAVVCTGGILFALLLYEAARFQFGVFRSVWEICVQQHPFAGDKRELRGEKRGGETVSSFLHGRAKTKTTSKPEAANLLFSTMCWIDNCSFFSPSIPPPFHAMFFRRGEMAGTSRIALCYRSWPATASFGGKIETTSDKKRLGLPN